MDKKKIRMEIKMKIKFYGFILLCLSILNISHIIKSSTSRSLTRTWRKSKGLPRAIMSTTGAIAHNIGQAALQKITPDMLRSEQGIYHKEQINELSARQAQELSELNRQQQRELTNVAQHGWISKNSERSAIENKHATQKSRLQAAHNTEMNKLEKMQRQQKNELANLMKKQDERRSQVEKDSKDSSIQDDLDDQEDEEVSKLLQEHLEQINSLLHGQKPARISDETKTIAAFHEVGKTDDDPAKLQQGIPQLPYQESGWIDVQGVFNWGKRLIGMKAVSNLDNAKKAAQANAKSNSSVKDIIPTLAKLDTKQREEVLNLWLEELTARYKKEQTTLTKASDFKAFVKRLEAMMTVMNQALPKKPQETLILTTDNTLASKTITDPTDLRFAIVDKIQLTDLQDPNTTPNTYTFDKLTVYPFEESVTELIKKRGKKELQDVVTEHQKELQDQALSLATGALSQVGKTARQKAQQTIDHTKSKARFVDDDTPSLKRSRTSDDYESRPKKRPRFEQVQQQPAMKLSLSQQSEITNFIKGLSPTISEATLQAVYNDVVTGIQDSETPSSEISDFLRENRSYIQSLIKQHSA